jgi:hypothetical protein
MIFCDEEKETDRWLGTSGRKREIQKYVNNRMHFNLLWHIPFTTFSPIFFGRHSSILQVVFLLQEYKYG